MDFLIDSYRLQAPTRSYVAGWRAPSNVEAVWTVPAHEAGDLIIVYAQNSSGGTPSVPVLLSGWSSAFTSTSDFGASLRLQYRVDADNSISSFTAPGGGSPVAGFVLVYRGFSAISGVVAGSDIAATSPRDLDAIPSVPNTWVGAILQANKYGDLTGYSGSITGRLAETSSAPLSGLFATFADTNANVSSFAGRSISWTWAIDAGFSRTFSFVLQ
jgi:hypothetical protein